MEPLSRISPVSGTGGVSFAPVTPASPSVTVKTGHAQAAPAEKSGEGAAEIKQKKRLGIIECETCNSRTYQDGSDDPGVSMKSPTKLSPAEAASAVPAHEREHAGRESSKAQREDREVLSNSIKIFTSVCPECGRTYVSGGLTTTVTRAKQKNRDENDALKKMLGIDTGGENDPNSVFNINLNIANKAYGLNYDKKK